MDLTSLVTQGNANPLLLGAITFALGALHRLKPGHSKTMIAAFVIAMRGTVGQVVLLGLSAALSHSLIVWILAYVGLSFGEEMEGRFVLISGLIIVVLAGCLPRPSTCPPRSWPLSVSGWRFRASIICMLESSIGTFFGRRLYARVARLHKGSRNLLSCPGRALGGQKACNKPDPSIVSVSSLGSSRPPVERGMCQQA